MHDGATSRHMKNVPFKVTLMTSCPFRPSKFLDAFGVEAAAGDVCQHIDAAESFPDVGDQRFYLACLRNVDCKTSAFATACSDLSSDFFGGAVVIIGDNNCDPSNRHSVGYGSADSTSPSGD